MPLKFALGKLQAPRSLATYARFYLGGSAAALPAKPTADNVRVNLSAAPGKEV